MMTPSSHWSVGELRFATLPAVPPRLLQEISEAFELNPPDASAGSSPAYPLLLRSADESWAVRLEPSDLALETRVEEPYDLLARRLLEVARIALPYLDTDFFTRAALRSIRRLPLSETMEGTRAIAQEAYRFRMAMTSTKTGRSPAGHVFIQETVGPSRGGLCTRYIGIYEEAVEYSRLENVLKRLVGGIEFKPDLLQVDWSDPNPVALPNSMGFIDQIEVGGYTPIVLDVSPAIAHLFLRRIEDQCNEVDNLNEERIRLLARKYAKGDFSREDEARLEILQERILNLLPSVEKRDFERLEELAAVTRKVHERHLDRMNRLGMAK